MNAMEFQKNLLILMMHVFGNLCILYRKRKRFTISFDFTFLYKFNGPGLCSAKRIPTIPKEVARKLRILLVLEIYLRYLEKYGSGICTFECHDKNGATKRLKSGKIVGIINKQLQMLFAIST
ncbi:hypothetical protein RGQ29_018577 [Quercus rubra]|uniref:Uncharacterized protein n=1 Tax=Quercus rubra TaxID=3512 RepID=A0AAN7J1V1_QUERU|nr:hypothetical protein RGQ29_018577 [Quercus rubra]